MEDATLDQDFLTQFSCMGTQDRDVIISELHTLLGSQLSREGCLFFLDMTNWNLQAAVGAYYDYYGNSVPVPPQVSLLEESLVGVLLTNTTFNKSWRIKNSGEEPWPPGTYFGLQSGCTLNGPISLPLPTLGPGEETTISVVLQTPSASGNYQSQWRVCAANGAPFGESIWVVVTVQDSSVLGLAEQLSGISTQDTRLDSEQCDNPFASHEYSPFGTHVNSTHSMLSINTQHSPILPRTPNPSPCSMQHGNVSNTELRHSMVDCESSKTIDSLQSDEGLGDDNT